MISFTPLFVVLFLAGALGALGGYYFPWAMKVVALYNSLLLWLAVFDYWLMKPKLVVQRQFEERLGLGREAKVKLLFVNNSGYALNLEAEDTPPEHTRHAAGRAELSVAARSTAETEYVLTPERRGDLPFGTLFLRLRGRMGLVRRRMLVAPEQGTLRVYPDVGAYRKYELLIRRGYLYMPGYRPSKFLGRGTAFERLREYQLDDDYQKINWKATARLGRPVVMEYEVEKNQNVFLMIDAGRLMSLDVFGMTKLDHALRAALVLAAVCALKGDNVGLLVFSGDVKSYIAPGRGRAHLARCMEALYNLEPTEDESDYAQAFEFLMSRKLKRSLVVLFSDFVDLQASSSLVKYLSMMHPAHLPMCVTLRDSDIEDASAIFPKDSLEVFEKVSALAMLENRNAVFHRLSRRGVSIINTRPEKLSSEVIRKYLELKSRLLV